MEAALVVAALRDVETGIEAMASGVCTRQGALHYVQWQAFETILLPRTSRQLATGVRMSTT